MNSFGSYCMEGQVNERRNKLHQKTEISKTWDFLQDFICFSLDDDSKYFIYNTYSHAPDLPSRMVLNYFFKRFQTNTKFNLNACITFELLRMQIVITWLFPFKMFISFSLCRYFFYFFYPISLFLSQSPNLFCSLTTTGTNTRGL